MKRKNAITESHYISLMRKNSILRIQGKFCRFVISRWFQWGKILTAQYKRLFIFLHFIISMSDFLWKNLAEEIFNSLPFLPFSYINYRITFKSTSLFFIFNFLAFVCFRGWMVREPVISELAGSRCVGSNPTYDCTWARYSRRCWACSEFVSVGDASPREINSKGLSKTFYRVKRILVLRVSLTTSTNEASFILYDVCLSTGMLRTCYDKKSQLVPKYTVK